MLLVQSESSPVLFHFKLFCYPSPTSYCLCLTVGEPRQCRLKWRWRCLLAMMRMRTMWSDHKRMVVLPWVHVLCNPFIFCHFIDERLIGNGTREFVQLQEDGHGHVCTSSAVTIAYYSLPGNVSIQFFVTATSDLVSSNERQHRVMGMSNRLPWLSEGPCEGIQEE